MIPFRLWWMVLVVVLLMSFVAQAQDVDTSLWEVALYHEYGDAGITAGSINLVSAQGLTATIPVPPEFYEGPGVVQDIVLSPDYRYLAAVKGEYSAEAPFSYVIIADLLQQQCCTYPDDPAVQQALNIVGYSLGDFNPEGTAFVLSFVDERSTSDTYEVVGDILVIDAATGKANAQVLTSVFDNAPSAFFGEWKTDGIRVIPSCHGCEPPFEGYYWLWNPSTGEFFETGEYWSIFGEVLPFTGEFAQAKANESLPISPIEQAYFLPANAVEYFPEGFPIDPPPTVFFNANMLNLQNPYWVMDGSALLIGDWDSDQWMLVHRDGTQQAVAVPASAQFLAGTPDGWLMFDEQNAIYHFQSAQTPAAPLAQLPPGAVRVLRKPLLGASGLGTFAGHFQTMTLAIPTPVITVTCPGFLPSRLTVGQPGRVTPGDANNLRSQPDTNSAKIGQIPGGQSFTVLAGPQCAQNMAWWQVNYNGVVGWTPEGQGTVYWLEPVS